MISYYIEKYANRLARYKLQHQSGPSASPRALQLEGKVEGLLKFLDHYSKDICTALGNGLPENGRRKLESFFEEMTNSFPDIEEGPSRAQKDKPEDKAE